MKKRKYLEAINREIDFLAWFNKWPQTARILFTLYIFCCLSYSFYVFFLDTQLFFFPTAEIWENLPKENFKESIKEVITEKPVVKNPTYWWLKSQNKLPDEDHGSCFPYLILALIIFILTGYW